MPIVRAVSEVLSGESSAQTVLERLLARDPRPEMAARVVEACRGAAVAVSVEFCVMIGIFMSFVLYVPQAARVHVTELTLTPERVIRERISTDPPCNRIRIYSLEGELFFGAAVELEEKLSTIGATTQAPAIAHAA